MHLSRQDLSWFSNDDKKHLIMKEKEKVKQSLLIKILYIVHLSLKSISISIFLATQPPKKVDKSNSNSKSRQLHKTSTLYHIFYLSDSAIILMADL